MDLKLRQYEQGKAFCDGVVARAGIEGLNRVWSAPEAMPTVAELDDPAGWLRRTEPRELQPLRLDEPPFGTAQSRAGFTALHVLSAMRATKLLTPL